MCATRLFWVIVGLSLAAAVSAAETVTVDALLKQREAKTAKAKKLLNASLVKINNDTIKKLEGLLEEEGKAGRKKQVEEIKTVLAKIKRETELLSDEIDADEDADAPQKGKEKTGKEGAGKKNEITYPDGTFEWSGHKYYRFPEAMKFEDAADACQKLGGHLLSIESQEEFEYFQGIAIEKGQEFWLDLKEAPQGKWKNWSGEDAKFLKWAPKQPTPGKDGVVLNTAQHRSFAGMETRFSTEKEVICEWNEPAESPEKPRANKNDRGKPPPTAADEDDDGAEAPPPKTPLKGKAKPK